jgi:outer membrane protein
MLAGPSLRRWMLLAACAVVMAGPGPARTENLDEAWTIAARVNPRLQASREKIQAAECNYAAAEAAYRPTLTNLSGYNFLSDRIDVTANFEIPGMPLAPVAFPLVDQDFMASTTLLTQPLYTGGRISRAVDAASSQVAAAQWRESRTGLDLKLDVATAYTNVLRAQRGVQVAESTVASLTAHTRDVELMLRQQVVPRTDLLAAQVALADARQREIQARNTLDAARSAYNRLLERPLTSPVELEELTLPPPEDDLDVLTQQAVRDRPELAELSAQSNALRCQAASLRATTMPQAAAIGGFTYLENRQIDPEGIWSLTFGVQWKPYDGGTSRAKSNSLMHDAGAVTRMLADARSNIALQVRKAWLDAHETRRRIDVTRKAIDQAEENVRVTRSRFTQGVGTNTEVLDAEALRTLTYSNYYNAVYDAALAIFQLRRAIGSL